jgi:low density lipoprotein receptor-related protein 5/6
LALVSSLNYIVAQLISVLSVDSIMFWTDLGEVSKIERAGMNGDPATRKVIVQEDIVWPAGLTVDFDAQLVYWLDRWLQILDVMDYEGRNRRTITAEGGDNAVALTMFQNKFYWTDENAE